MIRRYLALLFFSAMTVCGAKAQVPSSFIRSAPWDEETLNAAATLPVQEGGRVMPLQSYAGFSLLAMNGKRSLRLPNGEKLDPTGFLLDLVFFPEQAEDYECFVVSDSKILDLIGVPAKKRRARYSYRALAKGRDALYAAASTASSRENQDLLDKQVMGLARNVQRFEEIRALGATANVQLHLPKDVSQALLGGDAPTGVSFLFDHWSELQEALGSSDDSDALNSFLEELDGMGREARLAPALFPPEVPVSEEPEWRNPVEVLYLGLTQPDAHVEKAVGWLASLETLARQRQDPAAFREELVRLRDSVRAEAERRGEYGTIASEVRLFNLHLVMRALIFFLLGFITIAFSWLRPKSRWLPRLSFLFTAIGVALTVTLVTWRSILRGRPPVLNLYDTILFITSIATLTGLVIELINRRRVGLSLSPILGVLGAFLAFRYEVKSAAISGDTMGQLQAVLDTNFWLATHVTSITIGYGAGLLATGIAIGWILMRALGVRRRDRTLYREITRMAYGVLCFSLVFSVVGTILGGVWANESWGRFWGWDPKENGALLICLSQLIILHAWRGGYIRQHAFNALVALQGGVVIFSWWHVNELNAGLHSYGKTEGVLFYLTLGYAFLGSMALLSAVAWLRDRGGSASSDPPSSLLQ